MNTADRSISLLDTALRRRFGFIELMPDSTLLKGRVVGTIPLGSWLDALNERLMRYLKRDARNLQVGHSYLMGIQSTTSLMEFGRIVREEIIPLLEEYCYDDFETLKYILGERLVDVAHSQIRNEIFDPARENDLLEALSFEELQSIALGRAEDQAAIVSEDSVPGRDQEDELDAAPKTAAIEVEMAE
jgi:5-methylcytosine-specific restriction enzyme B